MPLPPDDDPQWDLIGARDRKFLEAHPDHDDRMFAETAAIMELRDRNDHRSAPVESAKTDE